MKILAAICVFALAPFCLAQSGQSPDSTPLRQLVEEAEANNPEIGAAQQGWAADNQMSRQASALPDTDVMVQSLSVGSPRPGAGFSNSDFAYVGFGASQQIPYPGKRGLRGRVAELQAASTHEQIDAVRLDVVERLKAAYFELAYAQNAINVLDSSDQLLSQVEQSAEAQYRVGKGNQQDVLKAQLQHTKILNELAMQRQQVAALQAELKRLLNRDQMSPKIVADTLAPTALMKTPEEIRSVLREHNPDLRSRAQLTDRGAAQVELAQRERRPDFGVQYMYQHTGDNFRDYYMATFSLNLPNRSRTKAAIAEATARQAQAKADYEAQLRSVEAEVERELAGLHASEERIKIYREGLIPQSESTFKAGLAGYQSDRQDFETLLSSFLDLLQLQLEQQKEILAHEQSIARLERLTGVTLQ